MNPMLDIASSFIIRGMIILIILQASLTLNEVMGERNLQAQLQEQFYRTVEILENDITTIGNRVDSAAFISLPSNGLQYYSDVFDNRVIRSVRYILRDSIAGIPGRDLVRVIDGTDSLKIGANITFFRVLYYNSAGAQTTDRAQVKSFFLQMQMESRVQINERKIRTAWQQHYFPRNI